MERYVVLEKVAEGVDGDVYRALDKESGLLVAIRKVREELGPEAMAAIVHELALLQSLSTSIYIVGLLSVVNALSNNLKHVYFLVFEHLETDLKQYMENYGDGYNLMPLPAWLIQNFMYQLCKGVDHCHSCAVLHRDLKPQNLLIDNRKGILKVGGLGLWRGLNSPVMNNTDEIGLFYRAPETLLGAIEYSNGVDIWSVGCIFAEMVRGYPFFHGDTELMQLILIFRVLGTPNEETWHGVSELEGWHEYPQWNPGNMDAFFPSLDPTGIDLLSKMLVCDPAKRVSAKEALNHPYFDNLDKSQF